ncbi:MAG: FAD-dependent oxidoreductase, partial [Pseudomonadota bacterium]
HPTVPFNYRLKGRDLSRQKITIIGAGPIGLCCAYFALLADYEVEIITLPFNDNPRCAGLNAGGMLAPAYEFFGKESDEFTNFALNSRALWDDLSKAIGISINPESYAVANSAAQIERLKQIYAEASRRGFSWPRQRPTGVEEGRSWLHLESDGLIDPILAYQKIMEYLARNGVNIIEAKVLEINNRTLKANFGELNCDTIIIAAGIGSRAFCASMPELAALIAVRGQLVELDAPSPVSGALRMGSAYILARGDKTIIGATMGRGDEDWHTRTSDNKALLNSPHELPIGLKDAQISNAYCGIRPGTSDDKPMVGRASIDNVFLACGAYRNGWLLAPKIAQDLVQLIKSGENKLPKSFAPNRFGKC